MNLWSLLSGLRRRSAPQVTSRQSRAAGQKPRFERLERRDLLSADPLNLGAVYYEDAMAGGTDDVAPGDLMHITFNGGAADTQLTSITIQLKNSGNFQPGDLFFDTANGGQGTSGSIPLTIVEQLGIENVQFSLTSNQLDGTSTLTITFTGFEAGDKLTIGFDVDEYGNNQVTPTVEGAEFEGSTVTGTFTAPTYETLSQTATFYNQYDNALNGTGLNLPNDAYVPPGNVNSPDYTAGAIAQAQQVPLPITIGGTVFEDDNTNNTQDAGEDGIAGVHLELQEFNGTTYVSTGQTAVTDANGDYHFTGVLPGTYRVVEAQPDGYDSVGADAGEVDGETRGEVETPNIITEITLVGGDDSVENNFAEARPGDISGHVYHDADNDGVFDAGEQGIGGVTIRLLDENGVFTGRTATTNSEGYYEFEDVTWGTYQVQELHPTGYIDGLDTPGTAGGTATNPGDLISTITLHSGTQADNYNFGELLPGSISGRVLADLDGDCQQDPGEVLIAGVTVHLLDANGNIIATTQTGDDGYYHFDNLAPGTYGIHEVQPEAYLNQGSSPGSAGGTVTAQDTITGITIGSDVAAVNYNFCEIPPSELCGNVYHDANNNGVYDAGDEAVSGVTIQLYDSNGNLVQTATTGDDGGYCFENLPPDTYTLVEVQPPGYLDGTNTPGTLGGTPLNPGNTIQEIVVTPDEHGENYNFGEVLPVSIGGHVLADTNQNCQLDPGETYIAGVVVHLLDADGNIIASTVTDANGQYEFTNLRPGTYGIYEVQPAGYFHQAQSPGSEGGTVAGQDRIEQITLGSGVVAVDYNFCEAPHSSISGYVFQDGAAVQVGIGLDDSHDGQLTADDTRLGGVTLQLLDEDGNPVLDANGQPITTVTDANGRFTFDGLRAGTYGIREIQPVTHIDWLDAAGSHGGMANNPGDLITGITIGTGEHADNYLFSEVLVQTIPPYNPPDNPPTITPFGGPNLLGVQSPPVPWLPAPLVAQVQGPDLGAGVLTGFEGGGGGGDDFTWHLSIIDGGNPRGELVADSPWLRMTPTSLKHMRWTELDLRQGSWSLPGLDAADSRSVVFGMIDGTPITGDFNGDGVTDVGVYVQGEWFIDLNGNGVWDEGDLWAKLGRPDDLPVTGDWNGDGKTDIGVFGPAWEGDPRAINSEDGIPGAENTPTGRYKNLPPDQGEAPAEPRFMKLTAQGMVRADLIDHSFAYGHSGDIPVSGDWNGDGTDKIGVYRQGKLVLDVNGNGRFEPGDLEIDWTHQIGTPVVGDFNGDGVDEIGIVKEGRWHIDTNGDRKLDALDQVFEMGGPDELPIVGDWNGDGREEAGTYRPGQPLGQPAARVN